MNKKIFNILILMFFIIILWSFKTEGYNILYKNNSLNGRDFHVNIFADFELYGTIQIEELSGGIILIDGRGHITVDSIFGKDFDLYSCDFLCIGFNYELYNNIMLYGIDQITGNAKILISITEIS